jgi:ubiquinone/menaquinone biosynthesis C-methylase UbiE
MPFEDGAFDLAVSIRLFGHLPHDAKVAALREMGRVSRRGVIVFFPIETRLVAARGAWRARHGRSLVGHRYPATKAQMAEMGKDGGLRMHRVLSLHSPFAKTRAAVFLAARRRA